MTRPLAEILGIGMVTPVGLTARTAAAAMRAGITRIKLTCLLNSRFEPVRAGFLEDEHLPPLADAVARRASRISGRFRRCLQLATRAFQEVLAGSTKPLPMFLALPEPQQNQAEPLGSVFLELLMSQAGVSLETRRSQVLFQGRAGGLIALEQALRLLSTGQVPGALVGGVDTYMDVRLLTTLDAEQRLHSGGLSDGFIPGEGAAFLWLGPPGEGRRQGQTPLACITSVGLGHEEGHCYSDKSYRGDGLAQAFRELFQRWPGHKIRSVYAGFNGENFWSKEWGVAYLRHAHSFTESFRMEHPVEYTGDPGTALGPMMVTLAAVGLQRGYREGPCLVWCSSDLEQRAAVIVEAMSP